MRRLSPRQYDRRVALAMFAYVAIMLLVWPLSRGDWPIAFKCLLAAAPSLPMLYVIALMAARIRDSDELEQRTHLLALGAATAVVGAVSLIGGFLAASRVLALDGSILIWVFPLLMFSYGAARWWVATRHYGGEFDCEDARRMPRWQRMLLVAMLMGFIALVMWYRHRRDPFALGLFAGLGVALAAAALMSVWRQRRRRLAQGAHDLQDSRDA